MFRRAIPQTLRGGPAMRVNALYSSRRWCVTPQEPTIESDWGSSNFYKRLGLTGAPSEVTSADIRRQYKLLVKVYHPDMSGNSNASDAAFKNIKEAYETLSNDNTRKAYDSLGSEKYQEAAGRSGGDMSEDFARRQAMRQAISGGLPIFLAMVAMFVSLMIYHYRQRMVRSPSRPGTEAPYTSVGSSAISSIGQFSLIFVCISVFPRVLSAALMYLMHASDCLVIFSKEMQANSMMMCTISPGVGKAAKDGTQLHNVRFVVSGIDPQHIDQSYMVLELQKGKPAEGEEAVKETLVFAPGVHTVTLPLQLNPKNDAFTYQAHVKIINENLKLTLLDKTCELSVV